MHLMPMMTHLSTWLQGGPAWLGAEVSGDAPNVALHFFGVCPAAILVGKNAGRHSWGVDLVKCL